jgi:pyruvate dehydrogenase complex dehydrogenase (E1) component
MAMVVRANKLNSGIGGHISTFASCATLYEVGFNHFFRGKLDPCGGDHVYFQGHASPGNYARAFLEGRIDEEHLRNFRRETQGNGISSYPHPWLMPDFWEFPTVSMGLGPLQAIYRARFMRYLEDRGLKEKSDAKVWAFVGDGESYLSKVISNEAHGDSFVFVAVSDYMKLLPDSISKWLPGPLISLGTDGYGRSGTREDLRTFFEVSPEYIAWAALSALHKKGAINSTILEQAQLSLSIKNDRLNPAHL